MSCRHQDAVYALTKIEFSMARGAFRIICPSAVHTPTLVPPCQSTPTTSGFHYAFHSFTKIYLKHCDELRGILLHPDCIHSFHSKDSGCCGHVDQLEATLALQGGLALSRVDELVVKTGAGMLARVVPKHVERASVDVKIHTPFEWVGLGGVSRAQWLYHSGHRASMVSANIHADRACHPRA